MIEMTEEQMAHLRSQNINQAGSRWELLRVCVVVQWAVIYSLANPLGDSYEREPTEAWIRHGIAQTQQWALLKMITDKCVMLQQESALFRSERGLSHDIQPRDKVTYVRMCVLTLVSRSWVF